MIQPQSEHDSDLADMAPVCSAALYWSGSQYHARDEAYEIKEAAANVQSPPPWQGPDCRKATKDPEQSSELSPDQDIASIKRRERYATIYLTRDSSGNIEKLILPVRGYGLWSTLWGFLALEGDGKGRRCPSPPKRLSSQHHAAN